MNIWIFNHYALPPGIPGPSRHFNQARELVQKGHRITIFASSYHFTEYRETQEYPAGEDFVVKEYDGVEFVWVKTYPYRGNTWKRYLNILDYSRKIGRISRKIGKFNPPDIIVGSSFHLFTPYVAHKIAKRHSIPFVSEIRDLWPETLVQLGHSKNNPLVLFLKKVEKYIYKNSHHIIVLFPKAHEYILSLGYDVNPDHISWIPNGVNIEKFNVADDRSVLYGNLRFLNERKFKVLNAGSLGNVYALEHLLDAASIIQKLDKSIHFYLVGNGPLEGKLKNYAKKLELKNVTFHGSVPKTDMPQLLKNSDLLYASLMDSPLYKWGMSLNKISEYLASAKPIVFAVNAVNNPVNEARAGITVKSNDARSIADAILYIRNLSEHDRMKMGERGLEHASEYYNMNIISGRLEGILQDVIKRYKDNTGI